MVRVSSASAVALARAHVLSNCSLRQPTAEHQDIGVSAAVCRYQFKLRGDIPALSSLSSSTRRPTGCSATELPRNGRLNNRRRLELKDVAVALKTLRVWPDVANVIPNGLGTCSRLHQSAESYTAFCCRIVASLDANWNRAPVQRFLAPALHSLPAKACARVLAPSPWRMQLGDDSSDRKKSRTHPVTTP